jgi:surfeit locus 1 family protein
MFRPLPILTVFTLAALGVLIALGTWQLQRREEKHALLAQIAARENTPVAPVEILFVTGDSFIAFRPAAAIGTFDHNKETYVYAPRADTGPTRQGYKLITPFELSSGGSILVDRGWIAKEAKDPAKRQPGQVKGEIEIAGVLLPATSPGRFTPPPDLKANIFYVRDAAAIAKAHGLVLRRPLILEQTSRIDGGPEPLPQERNIPDNHLGYAITWFSLGLVLIVLYFRYHYVSGRLRFSR